MPEVAREIIRGESTYWMTLDHYKFGYDSGGPKAADVVEAMESLDPPLRGVTILRSAIDYLEVRGGIKELQRTVAVLNKKFGPSTSRPWRGSLGEVIYPPKLFIAKR